MEYCIEIYNFISKCFQTSCIKDLQIQRGKKGKIFLSHQFLLFTLLLTVSTEPSRRRDLKISKATRLQTCRQPLPHSPTQRRFSCCFFRNSLALHRKHPDLSKKIKMFRNFYKVREGKQFLAACFLPPTNCIMPTLHHHVAVRTLQKLGPARPVPEMFLGNRSGQVRCYFLR